VTGSRPAASERPSAQRSLDGGSYLLGDFSYADVAMAVVCQFVQPVDDRSIRLTPATRRCWTEETLAGKYRDVIAWRGELYGRYRGFQRAVSK
jgi:glutathione S-transferase